MTPEALVYGAIGGIALLAGFLWLVMRLVLYIVRHGNMERFSNTRPEQ